ncbi:hypothetical protein BDZ89DRAFT_1128710 [Hymenopellis radicata]|nr:hypothetical protein BDZ89DRAFT_1128710 [Hymenopellis radicata]
MALEKSLPFTLERLTRLSLACGRSDEGQCGLFWQQSLRRWKSCRFTIANRVIFMDDDMDVLSIAAIPRISFDIVQITEPLETIKWWTKNFASA